MVTRQVLFDGSFEGWRNQARQLLNAGIPPEQVHWVTGDTPQSLFQFDSLPLQQRITSPVRISRQLLAELKLAACFRCNERWGLLYRILWRVIQGDASARLAGDVDGSQLQARLKAVRREIHHLHALVRFKPSPLAGAPEYVAWIEPAHDVLANAAHHFAERMGLLSWLIATPEDAVHWDGKNLHYVRPCPAAWQQLAQCAGDDGAELWARYYKSTFNPTRLNPDVMRGHMPVRFWKNLPEGALIPHLVSQARAGGQRNGQAETVARQPGKRIQASGQPRRSNT